jgi:hypothetical protein
LTNTAIAQNWTVGVPVHQQIIDLPDDIEVTAYCDSLSGQEAEFRIPLPVVSGVSYYVHVDNAIPSTDSFKLIHNGITQILGLGDSMLIVPVATTPCIQFGQPCEIIKLSYNGPVPQLISSFASIKFMAVGTPTIAGENYPFSPCNAWFNQGIGCMFPHYVAQIDILTGDTCFTTTNTVQSTTSIGEIIETKAYLYPNPTNGVIYLNTDDSFIGQSFILIDNLGRPVVSGKISSLSTVIEVNNLSKGVYQLNIGDMKKQNFKVIKE